LLVAVANVARILWSTAYSARAAELRKILEVDDGSPLKSRDFRNHFEHIGERLEAWANDSPRRNFVDSSLGPPGMGVVGVDPGDFLRNFDPATWTVTFRGDSYQLRPVIEALRTLNEKAVSAGPFSMPLRRPPRP